MFRSRLSYVVFSLIFLSDLLVMCSQLVANPEFDAHSQCPDHLHFSTEILCFFPLSPLQTLIMLKPFVCDFGSSPGVHTSPSILQMCLQVNLVAKDSWFPSQTGNQLWESQCHHFFLCLCNLHKLFKSSAWCLKPETPHGQWFMIRL